MISLKSHTQNVTRSNLTSFTRTMHQAYLHRQQTAQFTCAVCQTHNSISTKRGVEQPRVLYPRSCWANQNDQMACTFEAVSSATARKLTVSQTDAIISIAEKGTLLRPCAWRPFAQPTKESTTHTSHFVAAIRIAVLIFGAIGHVRQPVSDTKPRGGVRNAVCPWEDAAAVAQLAVNRVGAASALRCRSTARRQQQLTADKHWRRRRRLGATCRRRCARR